MKAALFTLMSLISVGCALFLLGASHAGPVLPEVRTVQIRVEGPIDGVLGDPLHFELHSLGMPATSFSWQVDPPIAHLTPLDTDARRVAFDSRHPGQYKIFASAGFANGQVASVTRDFELFELPADHPLTVEEIVSPPRPLDVRDMVRGWVAEVVSPTKPAEAAILAGTLSATANRLAAGQVAPGTDPLSELERAAEADLGPEPFARWGSFFSRLRAFVLPLYASGRVTTAEQFAQTLNNLAPLLDAALQ